MCKDTLATIAKASTTGYTALAFLFHSATAVTSARDPSYVSAIRTICIAVHCRGIDVRSDSALAILFGHSRAFGLLLRWLRGC
jgi:FtsH-binding integral membrane protein